MWLLCLLAVWQRSIPICPLTNGLLNVEGKENANRKPLWLSLNNSKVNHLLLVSSLNLNIFITYKCTIISPLWQHPALYGVIASQKTSCFSEHAVFLAAASNCWECNCFLIGTNNQCWLGFRAEPPTSKVSAGAWRSGSRWSSHPPSGSDSQGKQFVPGDCAWGLSCLRKQNFPSYQKKKYLSPMGTTNRNWAVHVGSVLLPGGCL